MCFHKTLYIKNYINLQKPLYPNELINTSVTEIIGILVKLWDHSLTALILSLPKLTCAMHHINIKHAPCTLFNKSFNANKKYLNITLQKMTGHYAKSEY